LSGIGDFLLFVEGKSMIKLSMYTCVSLLVAVFLVQHATAQNWPMWGGPNNGFVCDSLEGNVAADLSEATLMWESEESDIGPGRSQALRYGRGNLKRTPSGGCATTLVDSERLYQYYYVPHGDVYDTVWAQTVIRHAIERGDTPTAEDSLKLRHLFSITCDEILLCMDAATGKTIWKRVFDDNGLYRGDYDKPRNGNNTPCIGDGRIFVYGNTGALYAFDLDSGELLWSRPGNAGLESDKEKSINEWKYKAHGVLGPPLLYVDGVVIYSVFNEQIGFDGATGDTLWSIKSRPISRSSASLWYHDGSSYLITAVYVKNSDFHSAVCVVPRTGEIIWSIDSIGDVTRGFGVGEDYMLAYTNAGDDVPITCFKLSLQGAERLWDLACGLKTGSTMAPVIYQEKCYIRTGQSDGCGRNMIFCVDMKTGEILKRVTDAGNSDGFQYIVDGKLFHQMDGSHSGWDASEYRMFSLAADDPEAFGFLSTLTTDFPVGSAYGFAMVYPIVNGRLFIRGRYDDKADPIPSNSHIYCYDVSESQTGAIHRNRRIDIHEPQPSQTVFDIRGRNLHKGPDKPMRTPGVYLLTHDGKRVEFSLETLKRRWK